MKKLKGVVLASLGLAAITTAQAQTTYNSDLLIGFSSGTGNDLIYDLGSVSSLGSGETWNLSSELSSYNLNTVSWGVVGDTSSPLPRASYMTFDPAVGTPIDVSGNSAWSKIHAADSAMYQNFTAAGAGQFVSIGIGDDNSWYSQTLNPSLGTQYQSVNGNPNVAGLTSVLFYYEPANNTSPQVIGSFSLDNTGTVSFVAVPEPTTCGILAAAGLLTVSLNKLRRKQV